MTSQNQSQSQSQSQNKKSKIDNQVSLKLIVDKKGKKIIYGEADKKFMDFLLAILSLPVGTVIKLLSPQGMVGPIGNLYSSVDAMNINYFQSNHSKDSLIKPSFPPSVQSQLQNFLHTLDSSSSAAPTRHYSCTKSKCRYKFTTTLSTPCPECSTPMNIDTTFVQGSPSSVNEWGGYVKGMVTYMVMDDLSVKPMSSRSSLAALKEFKVEEVAQIEEKIVHLDAKLGMKLLRASLHSSTVLTDVFLPKIQFP